MCEARNGEIRKHDNIYDIMITSGEVNKRICTNCETNLTLTNRLNEEQLTTLCSVTVAK